MPRKFKFWISVAAFQVFFGLAVFFLTRQYYVQQTDSGGSGQAILSQPLPASPETGLNLDPSRLDASTFSQLGANDPAAISRQADDHFSRRQFDRAAELYQRLLALAPNNVNTYNNLGITLHYLGRSDEALRRLNAGVAIDPTHQRIWLTLGFVSSQLGDIEQARTALDTAVKINPDNEIGLSAAKMLGELP